MNVESIEQIALLEDREGDDVAAVGDGRGGAWIAWTTASLATEAVRLVRWTPNGFGEPLPLRHDDGPCFRPAITRTAAGLVALACTPRANGGGLVGAVLDDGGELRRFTAEMGGPVAEIALAGDRDRDEAWLAATVERDASLTLVVGRLSPDGAFAEAPLPASDLARRSPALATSPEATWLAWIEEPPRSCARLACQRIDRLGGPAVLPAPTPAPQEAPTLLTTPGGGAVVAWHSAARANDSWGIVRWLHAARLDPTGHVVEAMGGEPEQPGAREQAGEDQGWEFPALAQTTMGLWLAGRSCHGFHVAAWNAEAGWSTPAAASQPGWGGRGRRLALVPAGDAALFIRREPDGVAVSRLRGSVGPRRADTRPVVGTGPFVQGDLPGPLPTPPADVLFGDLHQHTAHSDGAGTPEELLQHARDVRRLDFAAITDHDRFCRRALGPATWQAMCATADRFDDAGTFAVLSAYEFTGPRHPGPGHKCVYFGDRVPPRVPDKDVDAIFALLREYGGLAAPHHVGWTGADFAHHDAALQPVWEVCSAHGCYEAHGEASAFPCRPDVVIEGHFARDALNRGLRFGFIGSTDSHGLLWHHGITPKQDPFETGLAGLVGAERTRASVLDALRARRTYATTGARIVLRVEVDGAPMGSELPAGTRGRMGIAVVGTAPLASVQIVRRGGAKSVGGIDGHRCAAAVTIRPEEEAPGEYLYVRVVQADGEMAWASPFWLG